MHLSLPPAPAPQPQHPKLPPVPSLQTPPLLGPPSCQPVAPPKSILRVWWSGDWGTVSLAAACVSMEIIEM